VENAECPHCKKETIGPKDRFYTGLWLNVYCPECNGRMCAQPLVMVAVYFFHMWNVIFFGFMTIYEQSVVYFAIMIAGWIVLSITAYYIPMTRLRPVTPKTT